MSWRRARDNQPDMSFFPSVTLVFGAFGRLRKFAGDTGEWIEEWRAPGLGQIETEFYVFGKRAARQADRPYHLPRKGHAGAHQLARKSQGAKSQRPDPILHPPRKFGDSIIDR